MTLDKAIDICRASKITTSQVKALMEEVEMNRMRSVSPRENKFKANTARSEQNESHCSRCGYKHQTKKCPAFGQTCESCHKKNHFAKMCKLQSQQPQYKRRVHAIEQTDCETDMLSGQSRWRMRNRLARWSRLRWKMREKNGLTY